MLHLYLAIRNPFHNEKKNPFVSLYEKVWAVSKNKTVEFQVMRYPYNLAELCVKADFTGSDHAGAKLEIGVLGYSADLTFYDGRHWNDDENRWMTEEDYQKEENERE